MVTRTGLRHYYFARTIARHFDLSGVYVEEKANYYATQREQSAAIRQHFTAIASAEERSFPEAARDLRDSVELVSDINAEAVVGRAVARPVDVVCLFGTSILRQPWLEAFPGRIVNLHLGLSPFYRGSATLFWPFVNRELQHLGTTIHLATARVDAGDILCRVYADLRPHEDYYAITSRLIRDSIDRVPKIMTEYMEGLVVPQPQERVAGRFYRKSDFTEESLLGALAYIGDGLPASEISRIEAARQCPSSP